MNSPHTAIDISNKPELLRLAEEVNATKQPRILKRDREAIAILMPTGTALKKRTTHRVKTKADYAAFRAAAGSWKDVDIEKFKADIYASRKLSTRPPVKL